MGLEELTLRLILFVILPLWVICGSLDYFCHKATKIEENSGVWESFHHSIMGVQVGIPIWLGIYCEINVLVMLISFACFIIHEWTAHNDVVVAVHDREVTPREQHIHSYLITIPFYVLSLAICRNWESFLKTITFQWQGELSLVFRDEPLGTNAYVAWYATLMLVVAVIPYTEELIRCVRYARKHPKPAA